MANCYQDSEADLQATGDSPMDSKKVTANIVNEKEKVRQMKRSKRTSGVRSKPVVPVRPVKKGARPSPLPRKRRASGKMMPMINRPYISEGDMAQADEMGDVDGHDEGFQDGQEGDNKLRKKTKKKPPTAYPEAYSTSPTPMFQCSGRRRSGFRKSVTWRQSRPKPRPRVLRQKLIPGDISTQDTTTPGPNSSDSHFSGEDVDEEEVMDISVRPSGFAGFSAGNDSSEMLCDFNVLHVHTQHQLCTNKETPLNSASVEGNNNNVSLMVESVNYNGMNFSRLGSDLSTAAQSSETSEHEQSGNERQLLYLVARGNLEPLHAMRGNTNSNNGNSSKKTNQSPGQNTPVPIPKPRIGRPPSAVVNGVQLEKEKAEKPKIPPKPAVKLPAKRHSTCNEQLSAAVAMKRMASPGTHISKRYSVMPLLPSEKETVTNGHQPSTNSANAASPAVPSKVTTTSAVKKALRQYEMCEPPAVSNQSKVTRQQTIVKESPKSSPKLTNKVLSQEKLKEIYSFVDTEKLRAKRNSPPPIVKPYKSSVGSSGMEDTVLTDSDTSKKTDNNSKPQKSKPINGPPPPKPIRSKPTPAKRQSLERSHSVETLNSLHLEKTSRKLGKSRSFGPEDMVKISQPKGKFSFLRTRALSFGKKKENSPKSTVKSEASPPNTVQKVKRSVNSVDTCDQSPQLSSATTSKPLSINHGSVIRCKQQASGRTDSPRKSPFSSPWESPSPTPKNSRPVPPKAPAEPQYETAEGFFHQVSRILKKITTSNRTEGMNNGSKSSNSQEEHIYETADGIQARIPLSPATWMKKKLHRSASQATKKSMHAKVAERSVRRTPSMDCLDDRMLRTTLEVSSSDEDDDLDGSFFSSFRSSLNVSMSSIPALPKPTEEVAVEVEDPLYQHIRTAEFGCSPPSTALTDNNTPLEIARRGSSKICKLWSQQSKVVNSGILGTISREEQKLQEAMFEVIATEDSYVRSLDVLVKHFMEDPGMNPDLPEGRRVLNRRQYHVIFSNVKEVHEVAKRFLEHLEERQHECALIRNICDIILDFASNHFSCYVSYCTNQIYQTRQLLECMDNSVLFREYVKRLESHECCQKLQLQSFLLLPMQRITRMPLLILNILNRIPLQHADRKVVEDALRVIQSVVTECNDSARAMERTEQLHTIYNQLSFGKMKVSSNTTINNVHFGTS